MTIARYPGRQPRASVYRAAAIPAGGVATATAYAIPWDTVEYDERGMWAAGSPTRLTCRVPGTYAALAWVAWNSSSASYRQIIFLKNSTINYDSNIVQPSNVTATAQGIAAQIPMVVGDYVEVIVSQNTLSALPLVVATTTDHENGFQMVRQP